jgi:hypothetical protein
MVASNSTTGRVGKSKSNAHPTIWLCRDRSSGFTMGYLVTRGQTPVAFVQGGEFVHGVDEGALKLAEKFDKRPQLIGNPKRFVSGVDDLRDVTPVGPFIDLPFYLLNAVCFPVGASGQLLPLDHGHYVSFSVESEHNSSRLVFGYYRALDRSNLPRWMREEKSGSSERLNIAQTGIKSDERSGHPMAAVA